VIRIRTPDAASVSSSVHSIPERLTAFMHADRVRAAIVGRYALGKEIGRGGMATVYLARDIRHERQVAIKVLHPELASSLGPARFQREIRLAAQLHHPHILPVYDSGASADVLWFAMPYVEGQTLRQRLRKERHLSTEDAVAILIDLARALGYAHRRGVIHRDVKPENVLLGEDGVFLMDFGVAKPVVPTADPQLTAAGFVVGTPTYMAPEQAGGESGADHRADLYSLGVLGYELLAGEPPFVNLPLGSLLAAHAIRDPEPLGQRRGDVPAQVRDAIERCLRKEPAERWGSAEELGLALGATGLTHAPLSIAAPLPRPRPAEALDHLKRGRAAFDRAAWREAYFGLAAAEADLDLDAEDMERFGEAAWWVADVTTALRAREQAYRGYVRRNDLYRAGLVALAVAEDYFHRRARAVGQGWLRRAERHMEGLPERAEHGWLSRVQMQLALEAGRLPEALAMAERSLEIADRAGDTDLQALAGQDRGRILVRLGRVAEGMALIEDAMTAATAGELSPHTAGRAICNMMDTCHRLGDVGRAAEWQEVGRSWSEPYAESGFPGICRVYRAAILRLRGDLPEAEREAQRAAQELEGFLIDVAGEAYYELGEIHLRKGDLRMAEVMFTEAHMRGRGPQPGLALLRLAEGKGEAALGMIGRALADPGPSALDRAKLLPAAVEIQVAQGRLDLASATAIELETITLTYASPALLAASALASGMVELASQQPREALKLLRRAQQLWNDIELPYELARTRLRIGQAHSLLGEFEEAGLEERSAAATLTRIGAVLA
jgi:tRNA A-37 threonylcarbamoyl transferase component Bud32/tetratricopeptide (TPR) repeat protein